MIQARIKRPDGERAGILLFPPENHDGWMFEVDSQNRQAVWRRWQDGQPAAAILGIPYQKPLVAQGQSLLRQIIGTFFGAIGIILITALVQRIRVSAIQTVRRSGDQPFSISSRQHPYPLYPYLLLLIVLPIFAVTLWISVDLLERIPLGNAPLPASNGPNSRGTGIPFTVFHLFICKSDGSCGGIVLGRINHGQLDLSVKKSLS